MSNLPSILIPTCALALVCGGLLLVAAVMVFRLIGGTVPRWLGGLDKALGGDPRLDPVVPERRRHSAELVRPEDLDFDAAVARYAAKPAQPKPDAPAFKAQDLDANTSPSAPILPDEHSQPIEDNDRPLRKRRRERGLTDDEVFGAMLDEDGDGDVDF